MAAVLVFLNRPETAAWLLSSGDRLAKLIGGADIRALVVRSLPDRLPFPSVEFAPRPEPPETAGQEQRRCEALRSVFERWLRARPELEASSHWFEVAGPVDAVVQEYGRQADGIVLEQAKGESDIPQRVAIGRALLESGRPVLVMPHRPCTVFGQRVAILWRDNRHVAKALRAAASWLAHADAVDVIIGIRRRRSPAALPPIIAEQGVSARLHTFPISAGSFASAALAEVRALECDMVIMGAYGHCGVWSLLLGSVTDQVLAQADQPVFLCH